MKLLIDIGNSSAKIAIANGTDLIYSEHVAQPWQDAIVRLRKDYDISRCIVSNVAKEDITLHMALQQHHIPTLWLSQSTECNLKGIPDGYGADRIAADLGALTQAAGKTILVIDAGTCITYDLIDRTGTLISGVISPGIGLRLKAMHEHTALLPLLTPDSDTPLMGHDTHTSMMSAAIHGTRFEVEGYIRSMQREYPDLTVFMTGGDAIHPTLTVGTPVIYDLHLLFKGLNTL